MSNPEEKKCLCDNESADSSCPLHCVPCKQSEVKQEPKSQCCNAVIDISGCPHLCTKCWKPMTDNIKTPEESKFSEDDFKYYTDTIVRIMKNAICKKGSTPNDAIDELNSFFAQAISAERNANAEKITKLEKQMEIYRLETIRWSDAYKPLNEKVKSLESKLAEAEKEIKALKYENERFNKDKGVSGVSFEKYSRLEAEAKAVRSKTEELLKALDPIRQGGYGGASFIVQEAIRALNSKKE